MMMRPRVTVALRAGLIVFGLCFPLLMLEVGVRLVRLAPPPVPNPAIWEPHPLLGWWHIPHSGGTFYSDYNEFAAEVRINARGLRDREIGYDNPDGAFRVLSLADSFGEALQVNLEQTYHKQLESLLQESPGQPTEVLNAGVGGWGTDQSGIFYLAEGFRYEPDIVLLAFFIRNDAVNNYAPLEVARNGGSQQKQFFRLDADGTLIPPSLSDPDVAMTPEPTVTNFEPDLTIESEPWLLPLADGLWQTSSLYRFAVPYLRDIPPVVQRVGRSGILGGEGVVRATHPTIPIPFYVYESPPNAEFEAAWALTDGILRRLNEEVTQRGSRLVVVIIGAPEQVYPDQWAQTLAANPSMQALDWDLDAPNRRLTQMLTDAQIPHLDLLPVFRAAAASDAPALHFRYDQHWTPNGHRLAAESIHEFLQQEILP